MTEEQKDKIVVTEFGSVDESDANDYSDAFIQSAEIDGRGLTDEEIEEINSDRMFVYEKLMEYLYGK